MPYHLKDKVTGDGYIFQDKKSLLYYVNWILSIRLIPFNRKKEDFDAKYFTKKTNKKINI